MACRLARPFPSAIAAVLAALAACGPADRSGGRSNDVRVEQSQGTAGAPDDAVANQQQGTSSADDAMQWRFTRSSAGPKLAFGEPQTDNVRIMFRCPPGGDTVVVTMLRPAQMVRDRPAELVLASRGRTWPIPLASRPSQLGGHLAEAMVRLDAEPLNRLRQGNPLIVRWGEESIAIPHEGQSGSEVERFLAVCGPTAGAAES